MKTVGIIAEFNPFHNGHKFIIESAKVVTGADRAVIIMSGDHVQRGEPAIMPKSIRTELALRSGADLVLELPACFSTSSAEFFAEGAVILLESLGVIDYLCFGAETDDKEGLRVLAETLCEEPEGYQIYLRENLRSGESYPLARQHALSSFFKEANISDVSNLLAEPNNILAVEYMKAIYRHNANVEAYPIYRIGESHHAEELPHDTMYASGSAIRNAMLNSQTFEDIWRKIEIYLPYTFESEQLWSKQYQKCYPVSLQDYSLLIKYALLKQTKESLLTYQDCSEELANRIIKLLPEYQNIEQFLDLLKTKEMTMSRIKRALLHILLNIKDKDAYHFIQDEQCRYVHVLGCANNAFDLISLISASSDIKLLMKASDLESLNEHEKEMYAVDQFASRLYQSVIADKFQNVMPGDYASRLLII